MKLQYHLLLFTFLLSEDVLCYKGIYEGAKDGSAAAKQGGSAGSDYLTIGGKKVLWPGGGNDQKGEGNKSSNPQGGLLSSLLGSVKRLLFPNGKEMESHVQGISDNVIEMKEGVIKNSSNIVKHANKLKEELQKNTAYWANVVKTTVSEELHQIDKFSKDQLDRLRNDPESKFFFTKLFQAGGEAAGKAAEAASASSTDEKKAKSGAVGGATPKGRSPHDDAEVEEEEKAKSFWDLLHIGGGNAPPPADGKEPTTGFLRMFKGDTPKVGNSSEKKEPLSWFGSLSSADGTSSGKDPPQKSSANGMKGPEEKKMSFFSHFTSKGEKEEGGNSPKGSATQKNHPNGEKEKNQGFTFNFFKGKDSSQEQPPSDNQQSDSHPSEKGSLFQWFNPPPKEVNNDGHLPQKEQSGGTTKDSVKGSQDGEAEEEEQGKNHSFSLLNMWKGTHKENAEKPQGEAETGVGSNSSQVIKGDSSEEATKGGSFFFNPFGGFKSDGESSHGGEASPAETTNAEGMAQSELGKKNSHLVDFIKNVYHGKSGETGEGAEKVLSLMNTEHEHNVSTNCHPLVSFKACLSTCFTIPPMVEGGSNDETKDVKKKKKKKKMKKNLSVGDYKKLEKCILKCRNKNFSERAAGCATKDGSIVAGEKGGYEENLKGLQKSSYNLGGDFSAFSDLTLSDKYADGDGKQGVGSIDGEILSANSAWVMDASGKQLGGSQAELQSGSHVELQSGSPTELQSGSHVELQSDSPTELQSGSHVFPNLPDSTLGTHLYSPNSSKSITGGEKKQPADRRNNPVGENSFSFFKTFAPQTGPTSDGVNPLAAANPSEEPPNGKSWAAAGGAPGKGPEGANHGTSGGSASGGSSSGEADEEEEEEEDFNDFSYVSKGFFLLLLLVTFSVYLSAFTNIITQFYVSFKEKVCLYVKGQYRSRFDQAHAESAEAFLPKGRQHSYGNAVHGSYDNLYHAFQESACDVA